MPYNGLLKPGNIFFCVLFLFLFLCILYTGIVDEVIWPREGREGGILIYLSDWEVQMKLGQKLDLTSSSSPSPPPKKKVHWPRMQPGEVQLP